MTTLLITFNVDARDPVGSKNNLHTISTTRITINCKAGMVMVCDMSMLRHRGVPIGQHKSEPGSDWPTSQSSTH